MEENKVPKPKEVQQKNSAEIVASSEDLLIEILLRLPIISLIRFESVSKHWQSLITNPRFCHLRTRTIGLMFPEGGRVYEHVPFFDNAFEYHKYTVSKTILHSCNGLLLCRSICGPRRDVKYYVCNPTTNQISLVPQHGIRDSLIRGGSLAFDPAMSSHYKIVFALNIGNELLQFFIYSSETGAWGVHGNPFTSSGATFDEGVYWNGALHWMNRKRALYFKIEDQVLDEMPKVPFSNDVHWSDEYYFGESCDHLHFVETRDTQIQLKVYEMKRDYSEWFVKYQVDLSPVVSSYPEIIGHTYPIMGLICYDFSLFGIVSGGKEEESFLVLQIPKKVVRFNLVNKTFKNLYKFRGDFTCRLKYPGNAGFKYIESLCRV
ncbi:hypothetical protein ACJIZ3_009411 [Penstemon smallii]|uniref:F-box domain-containing protein n=1 Tax=Penstemon smallii TaxID=265156 RepID=A0ABD3TD92_9LAMI